MVQEQSLCQGTGHRLGRRSASARSSELHACYALWARALGLLNRLSWQGCMRPQPHLTLLGRTPR